MLAARGPSQSPTLLVDHTSSHGAEVTQIRGILLVKSVENLRAAGLFERYAAQLTPSLREQVEFAIASSWIPIEVAEEHYAACDRLGLTEQEIDRLGTLMAGSIGGTLMSALIKTTRGAGLDGMWTALKQCDRLWDRRYIGGGVTVIQTGPKDLILENHGISLAKSRHWRSGLRSYWLALGKLMTNVVYITPVRARQPHPHRVALAGSWV
jgi:hypothetical protein